jgi:hypothetical protein
MKYTKKIEQMTTVEKSEYIATDHVAEAFARAECAEQIKFFNMIPVYVKKHYAGGTYETQFDSVCAGWGDVDLTLEAREFLVWLGKEAAKGLPQPATPDENGFIWFEKAPQDVPPAGFELLPESAKLRRGDFYWNTRLKKWDEVFGLNGTKVEHTKAKRGARNIVPNLPSGAPRPPEGYELLPIGTELKVYRRGDFGRLEVEGDLVCWGPFGRDNSRIGWSELNINLQVVGVHKSCVTYGARRCQGGAK